MKNILGIGEAVYEILTGDSSVTAAASGGIYPIIADEGVDFPFIIYQREDVELANSKDGGYGQTAKIEILCCDATYLGAINIALAVDSCLSSYRGTVADYEIEDITLESSSEDYIENAFVQNLKYRIEI